MLKKGLRYTHGAIGTTGYVLQTGLQNGPNAILVATSFHELKAAPKTE
jgi:hypothetical protein